MVDKIFEADARELPRPGTVGRGASVGLTIDPGASSAGGARSEEEVRRRRAMQGLL